MRKYVKHIILIITIIITSISEANANDVLDRLKTLFYTSIDSATYYTLRYDIRTARHWADIAHNAVCDTNTEQIDILLKACRNLQSYDINAIRQEVIKSSEYFAKSTDTIAQYGQAFSAYARARIESVCGNDSALYYYILAERLANDEKNYKLLQISRLYRTSYLTEIGNLVEAADCARLLLDSPQSPYKEMVKYMAQVQLYHIYAIMGVDDMVEQYSKEIEHSNIYNNYIQFETLYLFQKIDYLIDKGEAKKACPIADRLMQISELVGSKITTWKINLLCFRLYENLGDVSQARKYLNLCKKDIAIARNSQINAHYSPQIIPLCEAQIAIKEQNYIKAKQILDNVKLNPKFNNPKNIETYYKCYELLYKGLGDYAKAIKWLLRNEQKRDSIQQSYIAQRTNDIETILRNDTTILNQHTVILRKEATISTKTNWAIIIGLITIISICALTIIRVKMVRHRHEIKTQKMLEQRNQLRANIAQKTKELKEQKELISNNNSDILLSQSYAKRIQQGLLPMPERLKSDGIKETLIFYQSAETISGDFYWFDRTDNILTVCVADCSGHGIHGALMSTVALTLLSEIVHRSKTTSPTEILEQLNKSISHMIPDIEDRDGIGLSIAIINTQEKTIQIASAWQNIIIANDNKIDIYKGTKLRIGEINETHPERKFENQQYQYTNGTRLYMFTDGVTNLISGKTKEKLKLNGLLELIHQSEEAEDGYHMQTLRHSIVRWKGDGSFNDDFLLLGIEFDK